MPAGKNSFKKYQTQYASLLEREQTYRSDVLWPKYRDFRPSSSRLTQTERNRLESFRTQQGKVMDRMFNLLERIGGRNFRSYAPCHWVMEHLTFEDATTTGAMSVVPPSPYGYSDREVADWAGAAA